MAYEKQTWETGQVITAEKLNHMEDGIAGAGGVLVVDSVYDEQADTTTLDKTWQEIHDATFAVMGGNVPFGRMFSYVHSIGHKQSEYAITFVDFVDDGVAMGVARSVYLCNSADDYPVLQKKGD